jgi:hypothetical protein
MSHPEFSEKLSSIFEMPKPESSREAIFKRPYAWAFHGQLAFSVTETQFDLPAPFIGKNTFPRLIFFFHVLTG